jgi:hypothetical protein
MAEQPREQRGLSMLADEGARRMMRRVIWVRAGGLAVLAAVAALLALSLYASHDTAGESGLLLVIVAGGLALVGMFGGQVLMGVAERRAGRADSFAAAGEAYLQGVWLCGGLNLAAAAFTLVVLLAAPPAGRAWVEMAIVGVVNLIGLLLSLPRRGRLRQLFYSPSLPHVKL